MFCMLPVRKSLRLKGHDYSSPGYYFITICTQNREPILGRIEWDKTICTPMGAAVEKQWLAWPSLFPDARQDAFTIMPDHVHMILQLQEGGRTSLGNLIRSFKSITARAINHRKGTPGGRVWQRGYYEHIIRTERALNMIRLYIRLNPLMKTRGVKLGNVLEWTDERIERILREIDPGAM